MDVLLMFVSTLLIGLCFGFIMGYVVIRILYHSLYKPYGSLHAYKSEEDNQTYLYLELSKDIDALYENDTITFKVKKENFTQK